MIVFAACHDSLTPSLDTPEHSNPQSINETGTFPFVGASVACTPTLDKPATRRLDYGALRSVIHDKSLELASVRTSSNIA